MTSLPHPVFSILIRAMVLTLQTAELCNADNDMADVCHDQATSCPSSRFPTIVGWIRAWIARSGLNVRLLLAALIALLMTALIAVLVILRLCRLLFLPLDRVRLLGDVGYVDDGRRSMKDVAEQVRRRRVVGDVPPVYPNGWFAIVESRCLKVGQVKNVCCLGIYTLRACMT